MNDKKYIDFMGAVALILFSIAVIVGSILLHQDTGEVFYLSPGLMPFILGVALLFTSILHLADSLKNGGASARTKEVREWFGRVVRDKTCHGMLIGVLIMAAYIYVLLSFLPFWLSSVIFMVVLMMFLKSASPVRILLISVIAVALIVLLFQVMFRVPLP